MKATALFVVYAVVALVFGLVLLIVPGLLTDLLGISTDAAGNIGWRFFGLSLLGMGAIAFGSRDKEVEEVRFQVVLVFAVLYLAMTVMPLLLVLFTELPLNVWMLVIIVLHLIFTVWYGYAFFRRR